MVLNNRENYKRLSIWFRRNVSWCGIDGCVDSWGRVCQYGAVPKDFIYLIVKQKLWQNLLYNKFNRRALQFIIKGGEPHDDLSDSLGGWL